MQLERFWQSSHSSEEKHISFKMKKHIKLKIKKKQRKLISLGTQTKHNLPYKKNFNIIYYIPLKDNFYSIFKIIYIYMK